MDTKFDTDTKIDVKQLGGREELRKGLQKTEVWMISGEIKTE